MTFPGLHESPTSAPQQDLPYRLNRRTILKATAAFLAMAAAPTLSRPVVAEEGGSTQAADWHQPENVGGGDSLGFEADFVFNAIAPHWPGDTDFPAAVEIQLSMDGQTFTDPVIVGPAHTDAGPTDRDGRIYGDLLFIEEASVVRYRPLDADANQVGLPGLSFTYINAKAGPSISDVSPSSLNPSLSRPPIISRSEWGAERAYGGVDRGESEWTPEYQRVKHVIIHHSETPRFRDPLVEIRSIHYYHTVTRGWGDIGYNYLVDFMGNVYEGRVGGENAVGGHAFQYAHGSAGICSMGAFSLEHSTPEAIAGLTWISAWAARKLDPLGRADFHETPNLPTICGHRDVVNSSCPGDGLYADLPTIRWAVADVMAGAKEVLNDPAYSPGETVETTVEGGNLRSLPGTGQNIAATIPYGAVMHVVDGPTTVNGYKWYQLYGKRGSGWMASSLFTASDAAPPVGKYAVGQTVQVDTDYLNIRSKPTLRSYINATVPNTTRGKIIEGPTPAGGYRWYRLDTDYGKGWAVEQYVVLPGEAKPDTRFIVGDSVAINDPEGVRIRTGPGLGTNVVKTLPHETRGVVIGNAKVSDSLTWLKIQTAVGTGWIAEKYLKASPTGPSTEPKFARGDTVKIDTDLVNLREAAGTGKAVLKALGNGIVGTVIDGPNSASNMWWVRIDTDYGTGWVADAFLAEADSSSASRDFSIGDNVYIDTDGINIRTAPGTSAKVVTIVKRNEKATIVDGPKPAEGYVWYKIQTATNTGWGVSRYLSIGTADPGGTSKMAIGDVVAVDTDGINLRSAAGLSGSRVKVLYTNEQATVIAGPKKVDGYTWFKLQSGDNSGWAVEQYLRVETNGGLAAGSKARVFDGDLNLRSGAGSGKSVVAVLSDGTWVDILDGPIATGGYDWVRVKSSRFGTGWCVTKYLVRA